jgi:predicted nucleotidyltransferase
MQNETIVQDLVESLKPSDPYKIILFGSTDRGETTPDNDRGMPTNEQSGVCRGG